jgi:Uncharacterized protein conserved in bacteria (DUF2252)
MSSAAVDAAPPSGRPGDLALAPGRGSRARERASHRDPGRWDSADRPRDAVGILLAQNPIRAEDLRLVQSATDIFVGGARAFDEAMGEFAHAYADQTERDHRQLVDAVTSGQLPSAPGW